MSALALSLTEHREMLVYRLSRGAGPDCVELLHMRLRFLAVAIISGV